MAAKISEYKESIDTILHDTKKPWTGWLAVAEEKTGIKRIYLFGGKWIPNHINWLVKTLLTRNVMSIHAGIMYQVYISYF